MKTIYCADVDECSTNAKVTCPGPCINLPGTYACNCSIPGYQSTANLQFCGDVDECLTNNGGCEDVCVNTRGSYKCRCDKSGFKMAPDLKTCTDIDECGRYKDICNLGGFCFNTHGSYLCECGKGFTVTPDKALCKDNNECKKQNGQCQQICLNTPGSYHCICRPGFQLRPNNRTCYDMNECEENNGGCQGRCVNTIGSFRCICLKRGFVIGEDKKSCHLCPLNTYYRGRRRTGRCAPCPPNSHTNSRGRKFLRSCKCNAGFRGIPALKIDCLDIDECKSGNFGCEFGCENTPGSAHCTCPEGYSVTGDGKSCDDLNECLESNGGCEDQCINEEGFVRCECSQAGFTLAEDQRQCIDIDECIEDNFNCSNTCINLEGWAKCECPIGYHLTSDNKTCADTDECSVDNGGCEDSCVNIPGSFHCECNTPGFRLHSDRRSCEDINECYEESGLCGETCRNTKGSYQCLCRNEGFVLNADGRTCDDIDECLSNATNVCEHICIDEYGGYKCICKPGYVIHGKGGCKECSKDSYSSGNDSNCLACPVYSHTMATRHVSRGECMCNDGFHGDLNSNTECEDIDECLEGSLKCSHICVNVVGSAYCTCPQGYELLSDRKTCKDQDECSYKNGQCEHICENTPGAYWCKCRAGYEANPYQTFRCQDINECTVKNGGCSHICVNTIGSFYCTCPRSFFMTRDKKTCEERLCYILAIPSFGNMSPDECSTPTREGISVDTVCYFSCPDAYRLVGSPQRKCLPSGRWDGSNVQCIAKECPKLQQPKFGLIFPKRCSRWNSEVSEKCFYGCKPGYSRVGSAFTTCTHQEKWSQSPPICIKEAKCGQLHGPFDGDPNCKRKYGRFSCRPSCGSQKLFYRPHNATYICTGSTWSPSGSPPDCVGFRNVSSGDDCKNGEEFWSNITSCVKCPRGWFRRYEENKSAPSKCLPCPLGSYQENTGSLKCEACPIGWTTSVSGGANSIELCDINIEEFSGDVVDLSTGSGEESNLSGDEASNKNT